MREKEITAPVPVGAPPCRVPLSLVADLVKTARRPLGAVALPQAVLPVARNGGVRPLSGVTDHRSAAVAQVVSIV